MQVLDLSACLCIHICCVVHQFCQRAAQLLDLLHYKGVKKMLASQYRYAHCFTCWCSSVSRKYLARQRWRSCSSAFLEVSAGCSNNQNLRDLPSSAHQCTQPAAPFQRRGPAERLSHNPSGAAALCKLSTLPAQPLLEAGRCVRQSSAPAKSIAL